MEHKNVTFHENGTLSYVPERYTTFVPEKSAGDPETDNVIVPNAVLLGLVNMALKISKVAAYGARVIGRRLDAKPFVNLTVEKYLLGYEDDLLDIGAHLFPRRFPFKKFGILDRVDIDQEKFEN